MRGPPVWKLAQWWGAALKAVTGETVAGSIPVTSADYFIPSPQSPKETPMHIAPIDPTTSAVSHGGERYEPDENGLFDVPLELAERLLQGPGWEAYVAPEPTTDLDELRAIAEKGV